MCLRRDVSVYTAAVAVIAVVVVVRIIFCYININRQITRCLLAKISAAKNV